MSCHYRLRVVRLVNLRWNSSLHGKLPNLYVKVKVGLSSQKTRTVKQSLSPTWNEDLVFTAANEAATFDIQVKHDSTLFPNHRVGVVYVKLVDLLAKCTSGEATFDIISSDHTPVAITTGSIVLHLEVSDAMVIAGGSIVDASESIRRSKIRRLEGASDVAQSVENGMTSLNGHGGLYKAVGDLISKLDMFKEVIDALSEIHPFLTIAWNLTSALYTVVKNVFKTDQRVINLVRVMDDTFAFVRDTETLWDKARSLQEPINNLLKQTIECCLFVRDYVRRSFLKRMLDLDSSKKIDDFEGALASFKQQIESGVTLHTAFVSMRVSEGIDDLLLCQRLNPSPMDGFHRAECFPGTRTEIRTQIINWVFSDTAQNIFWLYGVAGSGKSTISTTIANHFRGMSRLGAFLFFERGKSEPSSVIRTIAHKLALFDSSIGRSILSEIENDKDIATASPLQQFNKLLLQPLLSLDNPPAAPVLIVLDALDECGTRETREGLMELFRNEFPKLPNAFRFIITSRQDPDIDKALLSLLDTVCAVGLEYTSEASRNDVSLYLRTKMRKVVEKQFEIPEDWCWDDNMELLGKAAGGLFIWASTAIRMVENSDNPFYQLDRLISDSRSLSGFGLDELYATVLESSGIKWDDARSRDRFGKIFALLLLSKVPLSSKAIDGILGFPSLEPSLLILSRLRSLITYSPKGSLSLLHASFSDCLTSREWSSKPWFIDIDEAKHLIIDRCFTVMKDLLRFNICDLESSFVRNDAVPGLDDRVKNRIPLHLEYACLHWTQHLLDVPFSSELGDRLSDFAHRRLLFWFEVLSLIKEFGREASQALSDAAWWSKPHDADVAPFLQDASKLAAIFTSPIMQSTPHTYVSMVPLLEDDSQVTAHYSRHMASMIQVERIGVQSPPLCLKVLDGHMAAVTSVAFSPNGNDVASASDDGNIVVWDIGSGIKILELEEWCTGSVLTVCFSPDGSRIVSGSNDCTLWVWDACNGDVILGPLIKHTDEVGSVAWSPDGTRIASGSDDTTIIIWDATDGEVVLGPLVGHNDLVTSVAFSRDSLRLASGSEDKTIRIWDVKSGNLIFGPYEGYSLGIQSVAFSPNDKHLISGGDNTIKIWEVESGSVVFTLEGHYRGVTSVTYSPCGTRIVSGSLDQSVIVWSAESGEIISGPLEGHTNMVFSVAYSVDGRYIASGSWDNTVRIWDATTVTINLESPRHTGVVFSTAISSDGSRIASASEDRSIIVWDVQTGDLVLGPLLGHTDEVTCVAFSPAGSHLLSGSSDGTIRIWDVQTGESFSVPLKGCADAVACIAISPDGANVACGHQDGTVGVWGTGDGELIAGPLHRHSVDVTVVAFSPNGTRLASSSQDGTIKVLDTETWEALSGSFIGCPGPVAALCFSPDGSQLSSGSGGTVMIWNTENGEKVAGPFQGYEGSVQSVLFSRDGAFVISGSWSNTIQVWNVQSGLIVCDFDGHMGPVYSLTLSPDGQRLVSGSGDNTIRMWDLSDVVPPLRREASDIEHKSSSSSSSGDRSDWFLDSDGWIVGGSDRSDLLLWIPPDLRNTLCRARNAAIFSCDFSTRLDFTGAALGERWTECFIAPDTRWS